jgi:uncharacterized protein with HEPN domain
VRDPRERLKDILEAIGHIDRYAARGREAFEADELIQSWFVRHLQIIGEAARALPEEIRAKMADIPWSKVIGMRHILVHDYFGSILKFCGTPFSEIYRAYEKRSQVCSDTWTNNQPNGAPVSIMLLAGCFPMNAVRERQASSCEPSRSTSQKRYPKASGFRITAILNGKLIFPLPTPDKPEPNRIL